MHRMKRKNKETSPGMEEGISDPGCKEGNDLIRKIRRTQTAEVMRRAGAAAALLLLLAVMLPEPAFPAGRERTGQTNTDGQTLKIVYETGMEEEDSMLSVVKKGDPLTFPELPEREGYTFSGWYTKKKGGKKAEPGQPAVPAKEGQSRLIFYARWEPIVYRISYNLSGCLENDPSNPHTYTVEDEVVLAEPVMPKGFRFMGWYQEKEEERLGQSGALPLNVMSAEAIEDYTYEYEYGYDVDETEDVSSSQDRQDTGDDDGAAEEPVTVIPKGHTGDIRLYAERKEVHYTLQYDGNGLLDEVPEAMQCIYGELVPLPAYAEIRGWNTRPDGSGAIYQNGQPAINIGKEDGEIVTLYAQKLKEDAWFPAPALDVSQIAYENYSHGRCNAIDFQPGGDCFAPFTGIITMIDPAWGFVLFQSLNEVCYADGTEDYMTVGFMHDNDVSDLYAGQIIEQGAPFYQEGGMGNGVPSTYGMHVDMCVFRGAVNRVSRYGNGDTYAFDAFYVNRNMTPSIGRLGVAVQPVSGGAPTNWTNLWHFIG